LLARNESRVAKKNSLSGFKMRLIDYGTETKWYFCGMKWNTLNSALQLDVINEESKSLKIVLFKHSTRCSISDMALNRLESNWKDADNELIKPYYLDLIAHRDLSNLLAGHYHVEHQSPQVLIISNGKCIYNESHANIRYKEIMDTAKLA
jgi:bacillithiol system protein YtxJ